MQPAEKLSRARELLSDPAKWSQQYHARDADNQPTSIDSPTARSWCVIGALLVGNTYDRLYEERRHLERAVVTLHPDIPAMFTSIERFNDHRTHSEVLAVFDEAIRSANAQS
jgi:hypothetical protein